MSSLEHTPSAVANDPLGWLRERLPTLAFSMFFSAAEVRPGAVVALPNRFLRDLAAQKYGDELRRYAASVGCAGVEAGRRYGPGAAIGG